CRTEAASSRADVTSGLRWLRKMLNRSDHVCETVTNMCAHSGLCSFGIVGIDGGDQSFVPSIGKELSGDHIEQPFKNHRLVHLDGPRQRLATTIRCNLQMEPHMQSMLGEDQLPPVIAITCSFDLRIQVVEINGEATQFVS